MNSLKRYANSAGLALILLALVAWRIWPHRKAVPAVLGILGVGLLVFYFAVHLSALKQGFKRRSFIYSSNLFLVIILVLAILVLLNVIFARQHKRFDFTEAKLHSLSDQSVQVLKNLKKDLIVRCFFREGTGSRSRMEDLMKTYAYYSKRLKVEFIDPDKNPGLVKRYEIAQDGTSIFECGDKDNRITSITEEDITNAVIKVSREMKKVIYFLAGHGEESVEESGDRGYSLVKQELEKLAYEVKTITLALAENFPADCSLLVLAGPEKDLLPNELETIRGYVMNGGRAFFLVDPETAPGLRDYLLGFGVRLENDLVIDTVSRLLGGDYFMPIVSEYENHEITRDFRYATFYPYARSVSAAEEKPAGLSVQVLCRTSPNSWSERQLDNPRVEFNQDTDVQGPISLAAVVTVKPEEKEGEGEKERGEAAGAEPSAGDEPKGRPEGRVAVFGDSDFASNRYYYLSGNGNFFLNTANWLTQESDLISIQPRTASPRTVQLTPSQGRLVFFVSIFILPLLVLVTGVAIWLRRRSL